MTSPTDPIATSARQKLVGRAMLLETGIITYNLLEGFIAVVAGIIAGSVALVGFGLDSGIEVSASVVVLIHLWRNSQEEGSPWERRVAVFVGLTLMALAVYVTGRAIYDLVTESRPDESVAGIVLATASLIVMPIVSRLQHSYAQRMNSLALEADSRETLVCSGLSAALLIGLGANALFGWWWADPIAALVMVVFIACEGWTVFRTRELICFDE
jgi:divalent metal cation (Fe/Co/Zn/Cd) transporter